MTKTIDFYNNNCEKFFQSTVNVDMTPIYQRFLPFLPAGGKILDAGCGSGRDSLVFVQGQYQVEAFDASSELCDVASKYSGVSVECLSFQDYSRPTQYDGIWACASLLHLRKSEISQALNKLWDSLKPSGVMYVSFKYGKGERIDNGRLFTDFDSSSLQDIIQPLPEIGHFESWITPDNRPNRNDKWINGLILKAPIGHKKLSTGGNDPFLPRLAHEMARATHIDISVSFVMASGLKLLMPDLRDALLREKNKASVRILTCDYLDVTDVEACRLLMLLQEEGAEVRIFETRDISFHMKAYIFSRVDSQKGLHGTAFIGSSNISRQALKNGLEWNYQLIYPGDHGFIEAKIRFEELFHHINAIPLTHKWIDQYEQRRLDKRVPIVPDSYEVAEPPTPTPIQREALDKLEETRAEHFLRGLVVLATGMGKTWLAAFDAYSMGAQKILFVAHREEILNQASDTFLRINSNAKVGYYMGQKRHYDCDIICASVQTIGKTTHLEQFDPSYFDYIVVDEFHHAAASTYRRLLKHFKPRFLLGLTATPDRSDQSDILSLCDNNLVYTCDLFRGISTDLLCPFHYYGIYDKYVDYKAIPWKNKRFDPESLSSKLATLGRAKHAVREWRKLKQELTLAFCASIKHADFMADQFNKAGIKAAAVYGGSDIGRAEALEMLDTNVIEVLFSVDLFNEGMDLPSIDTVMLLRPTESKILFLQQIGRGLRKAAHRNKEKVVILDFIGNHHSFLHKPQALFNIEPNYHALGKLATQLESNSIELPDGCYINYDLKIIDFLKALKNDTIEEEFLELEEILGHRPTITEAYNAGMSFTQIRKHHGSWFAFLNELEKLDSEERKVLNQHSSLLDEFETTAMTKSFKMVLVKAFQELNGWIKPPMVADLAQKSWEVLERYPNLRGDIPQKFNQARPEPKVWETYWRSNPVNAWIGGNRGDGSDNYFEVKEDRFMPKHRIQPEAIPELDSMLQEIIDYRLATYSNRQAISAPDESTEQPQIRGTELPFFPNIKIACGHFKTGTADAEEYKTLGEGHGKLDPNRHFIARASGNSMNGGKQPIHDGDFLLLERITSESAGSISNQIIAVERQDQSGDDQYVLRKVIKSPTGEYILRANNPDYDDFVANESMRTLARYKSTIDPLAFAKGQTFMREEIPGLFGESFNPGNWNSGHIVLKDKKAHILLVTLNKQGKSKEHRYVDHWIDDSTFHWQSQNSISPISSKGRGIIDHKKEGWSIHLFVREQKLLKGKASPFSYIGEANYESHEGSQPMSVTFSVRN